MNIYLSFYNQDIDLIVHLIIIIIIIITNIWRIINKYTYKMLSQRGQRVSHVDGSLS